MGKRHSLRVDIQILRAVAVGMVLLFHADLPGLPGGFLGVDVFLVISGYLITGMIARSITEGNFTFSGFYLNRAKRLLPAAYVVYLVTGILGLWLLTDTEIQRYLDTLFGALTFTANIGLWQNTNYFGAAAKQNVLLHVWSLSLEEQFYFAVPFVMVFLPQRYWTPIMVLGFAISLVACFFLVTRSPVATFYLLPTRAWELMIGAFVALNEHRLGLIGRGVLGRLAIPAFAMVLAVPVCMPGEVMGFAHPSLDALLVAVATAILIAGRPRFLNGDGPVWAVAYWLGGISYALYLVHWPLFAFAHNAYHDAEAPIGVRLGLIAVSLLLAAGLNATIERPIHEMRLEGRRIRPIVIATTATVCVWLIALSLTEVRESPRDYASLAQPNYGLNQACDYVSEFQPVEACRTGQNPTTILWGDSFAMHLVNLLPVSAGNFLQATKSMCAPAIGIAQINPGAGQDEHRAMSCIRFNDSVIDYLAAHPEVDTVVLSSPFSQVLGNIDTGYYREGEEVVRGQLTFAKGAEHFVKTVESLTATGRRVVLVSPTPSVGVDLLACLERREMGLLSLSMNRDCKLDRDEARAYRSRAFELLNTLATLPGVHVVDLFDALCMEQACKLQLDGTILYRDAGHFSVPGSQLLGGRDFFGLGTILARKG